MTGHGTEIAKFGGAASEAARELAWRLEPGNPVVVPGRLHPGLDDRRAGTGHVVRVGEVDRLYYWGSGSRGHVLLMAEAPAERPNEWRPAGGPLPEAQPGSGFGATGMGCAVGRAAP